VLALAAGLLAAGPGPAGSDDYVTLLQDALTPAAVALFDDLHRDLRAVATPLPERVRERLRPRKPLLEGQQHRRTDWRDGQQKKPRGRQADHHLASAAPKDKEEQDPDHQGHHQQIAGLQQGPDQLAEQKQLQRP